MTTRTALVLLLGASLLLAIAGALSALGVLGAFAQHAVSWDTFSLAILGCLIAGILLVADTRAQMKAWRRIAAERRRLWEERSDLEAMVEYCVEDRPARLKLSSDRAEVVVALANIELEADRLLGKTVGGAPRRPLQLRDELAARGYWSMSDLQAFDRAVSLRNSLVHANRHISEREVSEALKGAQRLLGRLLDATSRSGGK
jgi:hypothetical protein